jgi:hypothetical protein
MFFVYACVTFALLQLIIFYEDIPQGDGFLMPSPAQANSSLSLATPPEQGFDFWVPSNPEAKELLSSLVPAKPAGFLTPSAPKAKEMSSYNLLEQILTALAGNSSTGSAVSLLDLEQIEDALRPIIAASPKNEHGRLGDGAARYALHRLFMERHGWEIRGFSDVSLQISNSSLSSPQPSVFEHWVPSEVQDILEDHVRVRGFGILELSVFAASLEHVIRAELPRKLQDIYNALGVSRDGSIEIGQAEMLIDLYMEAYIRQEDVTMLTPSELFKFQTEMSFVYENWDKTREFFRQIQESVVRDTERFTFADVVAVLAKIEANFVYWNEHQCGAFKENLMGLEQEVPGRVRLLDFYEAAMYKGMPTLEKREYLEELGAIDETDPLEPRLILSNYLDGPSNCVARTSYYSVCCMDQCGDHYSHLERSLGKPEATPEEIISVVSGLSSATTCTLLPDNLRNDLHTLADANGGRVLLHGQAFAEWMHFVYPRECTWPQKFGPAASQTQPEWEQDTNIEVQAETQDLMHYAEELRALEQEHTRAAFVAQIVAEAQRPLPPSMQPLQDLMHYAEELNYGPAAAAVSEDEPPMIGASQKKILKKKRLAAASATPAAEGHSAGSSSSVYWWLGPALGALYGSALGVVKLLGFRSESLRDREASCAGAHCGTSAWGDSDAFRCLNV